MNMSMLRNTMTTKFGITGFVDLKSSVAKKYSLFDDSYWLKEYAVLLYLWHHKTENIIKYDSCAFIKTMNPVTEMTDNYFEMIFKKYKWTMSESKVYRDRTVVQIFLDLLSAVAFLHKHRIMHRDIKPNNIMVRLDTNGHTRAVLIDFSHAYRTRVPIKKLDSEVVTYPYRAPEIFDYQDKIRDDYNEKVDIWSIGMVMIEVILGSTFYDVITDGDESSWKKLLSGNYINAIEKEYMKKKRTFYHAKTYWKWIKKMLVRNPIERISAIEMFHEVLTFAEANKIHYVLPKNMECQVVRKAFTPMCIRVDNSQLVKTAESYVRHVISSVYRFRCDENIIYNMILRMVSDGVCTEENYKAVAISACITIESTYYDHVIQINKLLKLLRLDIKHIWDSMIQIIQNYDKEIFLYDTFIPL